MLDQISNIRRAIEDTEPAKVRKMSVEKLTEYEQYFAEQIPNFGNDEVHKRYREQCLNRMDSLGGEIQHQESMRLARWTLFWAVLATAVPAILALISHTLSSRPQPSTTDLNNSPPSLQTPAPTAVSQEPEASSSSATPSPEQAVTAQPSLEPEGNRPSP